MKKTMRIRLILAILIVIALCVFIWWYTAPTNLEGKRSKGNHPIYTVKIIHPKIKNIPIILQESGNVEAEQSVNIISQVGGTLKKIYITPGQTVKTEQLLFEIDSAVYTTDVTAAAANLQRDQAQLALLKATANRYAALAKLEYVTRQQYEESLAAVEEQQAVVSADQALLQQKKIQLGYTRIQSPISGKTGEINVHVGDLISANNPTPLVVINRLENVLVNFNIPQNRLHDLLTYQRAGTLKIEVFDESGDKPLAHGELVFVGNTVSNQTGTVQLKGKVANAKLTLWPGQLVTVRLIFANQPDALVIPNSAVQIGQKGNYVYLVKNNQAVIQPITLSREVGKETVVAAGLQTTDDVIGEIPPGLTHGSPVKIEPVTIEDASIRQKSK